MTTFARSDIAKYCASGILAAAVLAAGVADGFAQRASRNALGSPGRITIENQRDAPLIELKITGKQGKAVERVIATNLAPGKKITVTLPAGIGCVFDLAGAFTDESTMEAADMDLCKEKTLRLVE